MLVLKMSREEKFLIGALFFSNEDFKSKIDHDYIDYFKLVRTASKHLMLPSLYFNLKKKGIINQIPDDLHKYLKEIFTINKNRNKQLIKEVNFLGQLLKKNKINHVFFKGVSNILNDIYFDFGERMVGDIDILVCKNDIKKCEILLEKKGYASANRLNFLTGRHLNRKIHKNKIFAVEIHKYVIRNNQKLNTNKILKSKILKRNIYTPCNLDQSLINIYNYQINDYGNIKFSYSFKNLYDSFLLEYPSETNDKYLINYMTVSQIFNINISNFSKKNMLYKKAFIKINNYRIVKRIYLFTINGLLFFERKLGRLRLYKKSYFTIFDKI